MKKYIPSEIEPKWQKKWNESGLYNSKLNEPNPYYVLAEFAYPSGHLHMGHWFTFGGADIYARMRRMQGFNVFFPNGYDSFGLPAENAAIKRGIHPKDWTLSNIEKMRNQFDTMGASFTFDHQVITCLPEYYKWNQWIFLKMLEKGIAYRGKSFANWCPSCQTVLADEQVVAGHCDRCGSEIEEKEVNQWFLKITEYADRLVWPASPELQRGEPDSPIVDWPKPVIEGQNNWIGRSDGTLINFDDLKVFTTRPDTLFGATFVVISPEHPLLAKFTTPENEKSVQQYIKEAAKKSELERKEQKQKSGVFTGSTVKNPMNGENVPVWVADYVLASYGTGAIMAVPAHDQRDFEFAKKFGLKIQYVIASPILHRTKQSNKKIASSKTPRNDEEAYEEEGTMVNSGEYNGLTSSEARDKISDYIEEHKLGKRQVQYHLHDWSISRQRYWGTPIPVIYCDPPAGRCGVVPVPEKDLPVELPENVEFKPTGQSPLMSAEAWRNVKCPKCGGEAQRETDTMDGFFDNSWYFFRYLDPKNQEEIFDKKLAEKWLSLEIYFGGAEHTLGHTLYSRFFTRFFKDIGLTSLSEYAAARVNHGVILGPDGNRMSKSHGNVVNPDDEVKKYGADTIRVYLAFFMPYDGTGPWISERVCGAFRFLDRVWGLQEKLSVISHQSSESLTADSEASLKAEDLFQMHRTIKRVTEEIEATKFNTAVAALMEWLNYLSKKNVTKEEFSTFLKLLSPIAPHITEELWQMVHSSQFTVHSKHKENLVSAVNPEPTIFKSIHTQPWPKFEQEYLTLPEIKIVIQVNGKPRDVLSINKDQESEEQLLELVKTSKAAKFLEAKEIKKTVYIPGKILSLVTD